MSLFSIAFEQRSTALVRHDTFAYDGWSVDLSTRRKEYNTGKVASKIDGMTTNTHAWRQDV